MKMIGFTHNNQEKFLDLDKIESATNGLTDLTVRTVSGATHIFDTGLRDVILKHLKQSTLPGNQEC